MRLRAEHIQPLVMAGIMALLMTGFITWLNLGLPEGFLLLWLRAFLIAWPMASIAAILAIPLSSRISRKLLQIIYGKA